MLSWRKIVLFALSGILLLTGLVACQGRPSDTGGNGKLKVVTSFYVLADFAQKIGADHVEVINLVPPGAEPHDWEPETADLILLETADLLIYNGVGLEHWLDKVAASLTNQDLVLVEASKGIELLSTSQMEDPHVWLDPNNVHQMLATIRDALSDQEPAYAADFAAAYANYEKELIELDREFRQGLADLARREIIVAHEAFGYLAQAYDLKQIAIEGLASESEPDPARMAEIVDLARQYDVRVIFYEDLTSPKIAETIAREIGARTDVLNPLEGLTAEQIKAGEDYFSVMRQNLVALLDALE
jgi:zinc transport system substrate-binding protein